MGHPPTQHLQVHLGKYIAEGFPHALHRVSVCKQGSLLADTHPKAPTSAAYPDTSLEGTCPCRDVSG